MDSALIIKICFIVAVAFIGLASTYVFKFKKDNSVEELAEEVIKKETGLNIDLSPESAETFQSSEKKEQ